MIQVAAFKLPDQQAEANEFLKTHRPAGPVNFNTDMLFVFFDDGAYTPEYQISELQELLEGQRNATRQIEIALHVLEYQRSDLNPKHNAQRFEEVTNAISQAKGQLDLQNVKTAFVQSRIDALRAPAA